MHVALLGGTFDPPHLAHVKIIDYLLGLKTFDQIWVVPTYEHPFKKITASFSDRCKMCELSFAKFGEKVHLAPEFSEIGNYTIDLIRYLKTEFPKNTWTFIGGSDLEHELPRWKDSEKLLELLPFHFLPRTSSAEGLFPPWSSTEIRNRIKNHQKVEDRLEPAVLDFIKANKLYQS